MESILQIVNLLVTSASILIAAIFIIGDSASRVEFFRDKFPRLQRWTERRNSIVYLLFVAIFLQVIYISDLGLKEIPPVPIFSPILATIPAPIVHVEERPAIQGVNKTTVPPVLRREPSLRDRANKLANELQGFTEERDKHLPEVHEKDGSTVEQLQATLAPQRAYQQETYKLYTDRFSVRVVTIVQEFKALGVDVSQIESCAAYGVCPTMPIPIQLHALAARLDDSGNVRRP